MTALLKHLNPSQLAAVTVPSGSALIIAGAGSGKTRVLTTRIAWLLETGQARPANILAVTFTNKAAKEMLARVQALLPLAVHNLWVGTFHGLCHRMLRLHAGRAGLPNAFQILDTADQNALVKRLLKAMNLDDEKYPPRQAVFYINSAKEQGLRAHQVETQDAFHRVLQQIYAAYEAQCQKEGLVDFAELLLRCDELLRSAPDLCAHYQARFRYILVDEFQDTNDVQYGWLKRLSLSATAPASQVFAVGDDDQSIYAFRGAKVAHMLAFERDFAVQHVVRLEHNYRSHGNILDCANALISFNSGRLGKNLFTEAGAGELVRIMETISDNEEAQWIVEQIEALANSGSALNEIAVLYRANAQSRMIEHALFRAGLPYRVFGGLRFFDRAEVKHALAYLQLIENPQNDTAFLRVVNFPPRGIGARSLEQLQDAAVQSQESLYRSARFLSGKAGTTLASFIGMIEDLQQFAQNNPLNSVIETLCNNTGLLAHYQAERDGAERVENLYQLVSAAADFVQETSANDAVANDVASNDAAPIDRDAELATDLLSESPSESALVKFLAHAALESGERQAEAGVAAIQLMTVHSAKGLEFDAVFITGLEEGLFPHENSLLTDEGCDEERRLMYVAITRARHRLFLTYAKNRMLHGRTRFGIASRFIDELPKAHIKWLSARAEHPWWQTSQSDQTQQSEHSEHINANSIANTLANSMAQNRSTTAFDGAIVRIGQRVEHPKFGLGTIEHINGQKEARIRFDNAGSKVLDLTVAVLTSAE